MNDRGPMFASSDIRMDVDYLQKWWWGEVRPHSSVLTVDEHSYKMMKKSKLHVRLITRNPSWELLDAINAHFDALALLIVDSLPDTLPTNYTPLKVNTLVCMSDLKLLKAQKKLFRVQHLFVHSINTLPICIKLPNLHTLSCMQANFNAIANVRCDNIKTLDLYQMNGEHAMNLHGHPTKIRIDTRLIGCVNINKAELLQFYGDHKVSVTENFIDELNKAAPKNLIVGLDMFTSSQIARLYTPKVLGVYIEDKNLQRFVSEEAENVVGSKIFIYSVLNLYQMIQYSVDTITANFDIFNAPAWNTLITEYHGNILIKDCLIHSHGMTKVIAKKNTNISYSPHKAKVTIGLTRKTALEIYNTCLKIALSINKFKRVAKIKLNLYEFSWTDTEKQIFMEKMKEKNFKSITIEENVLRGL